MHPTNRLRLDVPDVTDAVSLGPSDFEEVFNILDASAVVYEGVDIARPFPRTYGTFWYSTDKNALYFDTGSVWLTVISPTSGTPIGAQTPYAGVGDPVGGTEVWVVADGRLIDKTTYATFFAVTGHVYNPGGIDPGSNKVRIPDKRGKKSVGAINMGTAAGPGPGDNAHHQGVRGTSYGEVDHRLAWNEGSVNGYGTTGFDNPDHSHSIDSGRSVITSSGGWGLARPADVGSPLLVPVINGATNTPDGVGGRSVPHAHSLTSRDADAVHNNIDPCEADTWIVRIG